MLRSVECTFVIILKCMDMYTNLPSHIHTALVRFESSFSSRVMSLLLVSECMCRCHNSIPSEQELMSV